MILRVKTMENMPKLGQSSPGGTWEVAQAMKEPAIEKDAAEQSGSVAQNDGQACGQARGIEAGLKSYLGTKDEKRKSNSNPE